jgi:hypothetical protein
MPSPTQPCPDCKTKMTYDSVLSSKVIKVYWCMICDFIVVEKRFTVKDKVKSVRRFIFKSETP